MGREWTATGLDHAAPRPPPSPPPPLTPTKPNLTPPGVTVASPQVRDAYHAACAR